MHTVSVLALDQVIPFDLATPIEVFTRPRLPGGRAAYRVRICGATPTVDAGMFTLRPPWGLEALADADTMILPGCADVTVPVPDIVLDALRRAAARGARIASICSGARSFARVSRSCARVSRSFARVSPLETRKRHLGSPATSTMFATNRTGADDNSVTGPG